MDPSQLDAEPAPPAYGAGRLYGYLSSWQHPWLALPSRDCMHGRKHPSLDSTAVAKDTLMAPVPHSVCCKVCRNLVVIPPPITTGLPRLNTKEKDGERQESGGTIVLDHVSWRDRISTLNKRPGREVTRPRYVKRQKGEESRRCEGVALFRSRHPYPQRPGVSRGEREGIGHTPSSFLANDGRTLCDCKHRLDRWHHTSNPFPPLSQPKSRLSFPRLFCTPSDQVPILPK